MRDFAFRPGLNVFFFHSESLSRDFSASVVAERFRAHAALGNPLPLIGYADFARPEPGATSIEWRLRANILQLKKSELYPFHEKQRAGLRDDDVRDAELFSVIMGPAHHAALPRPVFLSKGSEVLSFLGQCRDKTNGSEESSTHSESTTPKSAPDMVVIHNLPSRDNAPGYSLDLPWEKLDTAARQAGVVVVVANIYSSSATERLPLEFMVEGSMREWKTAPREVRLRFSERRREIGVKYNAFEGLRIKEEVSGGHVRESVVFRRLDAAAWDGTFGTFVLSDYDPSRSTMLRSLVPMDEDIWAAYKERALARKPKDKKWRLFKTAE